MYINGGMIQTLNSTQYNPQKPVFHSYTLFSQIYTCIHSHSCIHLHSPLHSLCLLSSLFYLLFSVFHTQHFLYSALSPVSLFIGEWRSIDSNPCAEPTTTMTKVMVVGERLTKMLTIATETWNRSSRCIILYLMVAFRPLLYT